MNIKILFIIVCLNSFSLFSYFEKSKENSIQVEVIYRKEMTFFGHIAFKITDGFSSRYFSYPSGNDERSDREYYGKVIEVCRIYITREKYQKFLKWYKSSLYSKFSRGNEIYTYGGHYHIVHFNCAHFVEYSLRSMGIPLERFFTLNPRTPAFVFKKLKDFIKNINHKKVRKLSNVHMQVIDKEEMTKEEYFKNQTNRNGFLTLFSYFLPNFNECMYFYGS